MVSLVGAPATGPSLRETRTSSPSTPAFAVSARSNDSTRTRDAALEPAGSSDIGRPDTAAGAPKPSDRTTADGIATSTLDAAGHTGAAPANALPVGPGVTVAGA